MPSIEKNLCIWHFWGCLNKRAARLRLAVQAPAITTTEQGGTQSARERAFAAEPLGDPPLFSVRQAMSFNAMLYAVFNCNWQRFLDYFESKTAKQEKT